MPVGCAASWTGTLPEAEQAELEAHLEACEACRRALERLAAASRFWDDLRRFAGPAADDDPAGRRRSTTMTEPLDFLEPDDAPGPDRPARPLRGPRGPRPGRHGHRAQGVRPGAAPGRGDQGAGPRLADQRDGPPAVPPRGAGGGRGRPRARRRHPRRRRGQRAALPGHAVHRRAGRSRSGSTATGRWS